MYTYSKKLRIYYLYFPVLIYYTWAKLSDSLSANLGNGNKPNGNDGTGSRKFNTALKYSPLRTEKEKEKKRKYQSLAVKYCPGSDQLHRFIC
jgi:hypothetical protein